MSSGPRYFDATSSETDNAPWGSDHRLDAEDALVVLRESFPHAGIEEVVAIGEGWDFRVFVANDKWVFRFPKRKPVVASLHMEQELLPLLEELLPVRVPQYTYCGHPHRLFPHDFAGYKILRGKPLGVESCVADNSITIARQIGAFLTRLHSLSVHDLGSVGHIVEHVVPDAERIRHDVAARLCTCERFLTGRAFAALGAHVAKWEPPPQFADFLVLVHRDLRPEHIVFEERGSQLSAIIDWSDAGFAPAWTDFLWLWIFYGRSFVREMLAEYGRLRSVEGFLDSIAGFGLWKAINELAYGIQSGDKGKASVARRALEREFER